MIENTSTQRDMETQRFREVSTALKVIDKFEKQDRPVKPTLEPDYDDKSTYEIKMIEYEILTALYLEDMKTWEKEGDGEPALVNIVPPAKVEYKTTAA